MPSLGFGWLADIGRADRKVGRPVPSRRPSRDRRRNRSQRQARKRNR